MQRARFVRFFIQYLECYKEVCWYVPLSKVAYKKKILQPKHLAIALEKKKE